MSVIERNFNFYDSSDLLKRNGNLIREKLRKILEKEDLNLDQELRDLLQSEFDQYKAEILDQLAVLDQPLIFKTNGKQDSQLAYEVKMGQLVLAKASQVKNVLQLNNQELVEIFSAILLSDIGKAGPKTPTQPEELVVGRLFSQAIFSEIHKVWLKKTRPSQLPPNIKNLLRQLNGKEIFGIFLRGEFKQQPIDFYLYVIKQIALELAGQNENLKIEAEKIYTLTEAERFLLLSLGADPKTQAIGKFFTWSHITFGERFLSRNDVPRNLVNLALAHHFSQGVLPKGLDLQATLKDEELLKKIAFLEILDKCDAFGSRFRIEEHQTIRNKTWGFIQTQLGINYPDQPQLISLYRAIFESMIDQEII